MRQRPQVKLDVEHTPSTENGPPPSEPAPDPMLGRKLGKYRIVRKIAEGGMGAVYEAADEELGRRAAVKVLLRELVSNAESSNRFFNEARAISLVSHPSLVTIFEHGRSEDGEAYIVMEYLAGESLRQRLEKRYLGGSAVLLMRQLASALAATHSKRIIHRDLKPENIMLIRDDEVAGGERAKILDFGIAKLLPDGTAGSAPEDKRMVKTRTGTLIGTPTYMSPEQCRASDHPDEKTDVYSLGVILYELIYGDPPFVSDSAGELFALQMFAVPPDLKQRVPAVDPWLAALVHRLLDKSPAKRPSMAELLAELQSAPASGLSDGEIEARPSHRLARARASGALPLEALVDPTQQIRERLANTTGNTGNATRGEVVPTRRALPVALAGALMLLCVGGVLWFLRAHDPHPAIPDPTRQTPVSASTAPLPASKPSPPDGGTATGPQTPRTVAAPDRDPRTDGTPDPATPSVSSSRHKPGKTPRSKKGPRAGTQGTKDGAYQTDIWQ